MEAGTDTSGLIESLIAPERFIPDRRGAVPSRTSIALHLMWFTLFYRAGVCTPMSRACPETFRYHSQVRRAFALCMSLHEAAGPTASRALLRRMLAAAVDDKFKEEPVPPVSNQALGELRVFPGQAQQLGSRCAGRFDVPPGPKRATRQVLVSFDVSAELCRAADQTSVRFVRFFTRRVWLGNGGAPRTGRGTGKRPLVVQYASHFQSKGLKVMLLSTKE